MATDLDTIEPLTDLRFESVARFFTMAMAGVSQPSASRGELAALMIGRTIVKHLKYFDKQTVTDLHQFIDAVAENPAVGGALTNAN